MPSTWKTPDWSAFTNAYKKRKGERKDLPLFEFLITHSGYRLHDAHPMRLQ